LIVTSFNHSHFFQAITGRWNSVAKPPVRARRPEMPVEY
jgi:hypothetical protein